jgi:hypothetical protein
VRCEGQIRRFHRADERFALPPERFTARNGSEYEEVFWGNSEIYEEKRNYLKKIRKYPVLVEIGLK